jgi:hypothetical protein
MDVPNVIKDKSDVLKVYYYTAMAAARIQNATPAELATGDKGAHLLLALIPTYFAAANKPAGATDAVWASTRKGLEDLGNGVELTIASYPGDQLAAAAKTPADWVGVAQAYRTALTAYPDSWNLAYKLGGAILRQANPDTYAQGLYFVARAVALDPAKGGIPDAATRTTYDNFLKRSYVSFHGGDDGLAELKQLAATSAFPPADFKIKNTSEIAMEKQAQLAHDFPELALWMQLKGMLAGPDGDKNFEDMKGTLVKGLKGQIMSGDPACRSKALLIGVPLPNSTATLTGEITLKLGTFAGDKFVEKALTGKPVAGTEIKWEGQPIAFTKDPFMLTMNVDQADIQGILTDPCTPPALKKTPVGAKKPAAKKPQ